MPQLHNPVYDALISGDKSLAMGTDKVKYFDPEVSPFIGIESGYMNGFDDLFNLLSAGRYILHATPQHIRIPRGWELIHKVQGIQMMLTKSFSPQPTGIKPVWLTNGHVAEMKELAALTRPGPFGSKTIEFGFYHGIFADGKLAAMTGQRLHVNKFTEISAVCTHPDHLGKGYAAALVQHQAELIHDQGQQAFLHVRKDNERAITLYKRLGFVYSGDMNFYFMKRRSRMNKML
ncbi:MAG TPA: GNAT family N-acetyltransferase [Flavisolibacter sp.]|jgi:ribosomal protein S18 acetylase RimI-like enzyme|nr:GNAT family N-acetyltransferase [Flavisolibacter sp.]